MARRGVRAQLLAIAYRLYFSAYVVVFGFAVLHDVSGDDARPLTISPRGSALAGAVVIGVVFAASLVGRLVVALKPSPADVQLALLSPVDRPTTLGRPIASTATVSTFAAGGAAVVLMVVASPQFAGLGTGTQLAYVAFAGSIGLITYGGHLLVAERRFRIVVLGASALLVAASAFDIARASTWSPMTAAIRGLREGAGFFVVLSSLMLGSLLVWLATIGAEGVELEKISRGGDVADLATVALAGDDLRSLFLLQRSMAARPWRQRPWFRLSPALARHFPVATRTLRGLVRWRVYRWTVVIAMLSAIGALVRVQPGSVRTVGLAAVALWVLGLAVSEPYAQEQDRADRLALLPMARRIEFRLIGASWTLLFIALAITCVATLAGTASVATALCLAAACASAATTAACISFRRAWKDFSKTSAIVDPAYAGANIAFAVMWPAIAAAFCIAPWAVQGRGVALLPASAIALGGLALWIVSAEVRTKLHRLAPRLFPETP